LLSINLFDNGKFQILIYICFLLEYFIGRHFLSIQTFLVAQQDLLIAKWTLISGPQHILQATLMHMMVALLQLSALFPIQDLHLTEGTVNLRELEVSFWRFVGFIKRLC